MAAIVGVSLTACTSAPSTGDCAATPSGSLSDSVSVSGDFGAEPTVTFTSPLDLEATQRTVVTSGDGKQYAEKNDIVTFDYVLYNASTGARLTATPYTEADRATFIVNTNVYLPGLIDTIHCSSVGSRVVGVIPAAEGFGTTGSDLGVAAGENLLFVVDVQGIEPGIATGTAQSPVAGLPTVKLADDGTPTLTIPDADPPTDLKVEVLKQGDGTVVADGDAVTLQYLGVNWNTGAVFDKTWDVREPQTFTTNSVVTGFGQALVGQKVGSQILAVIPPDLGYGPVGGSGDQIGATDTIVFVIDILATAAPTAQ
jgi:FKBP-type peptidyl-prolyl cis-trans isomerase